MSKYDNCEQSRASCEQKETREHNPIMPLILEPAPTPLFMRGNWNIYIIIVGSSIAYWLATGIPAAIQKRASERLGPSIPPAMIGHFVFAVITVACWYAIAHSLLSHHNYTLTDHVLHAVMPLRQHAERDQVAKQADDSMAAH